MCFLAATGALERVWRPGKSNHSRKEMVLNYQETGNAIGTAWNHSIAHGCKVLMQSFDLTSLLQCVARDREGPREPVDMLAPQMPTPRTLELEESHVEDREPKLATITSCEPHTITEPLSTVLLTRHRRRHRAPESETDTASTCSLSSNCCSASYAGGSNLSSRASSVREDRRQSAFAWRWTLPFACRVWEDTGPPPCPLTVSSRLAEEPLVLCCAQKGRWCPLSVDRKLTVGSFFWAEGHALKLMHDYTDLFTINVTNSIPGDPTQILFTSADQGHYLHCVNNMLCERARLAGMGGAWKKLELRPALPGNYYCFHLYASQLPVCFDEGSSSLVQCSPAPDCERAVFALQSASSAMLLQDIMELERRCSDQRSMFNSLDELVRQHPGNGTSDDCSADFLDLERSRDAEEEQLVFLQDNFAFVTEQLQYSLFGAGHATATQARIPDSEESLSSRSSKSESSCSGSVSKLASTPGVSIDLETAASASIPKSAMGLGLSQWNRAPLLPEGFPMHAEFMV